MKSLVASVLAVCLVGGCVYGKGPDPVYVLNFKEWTEAGYYCKNKGGILHYAFYKDGEQASGFVCKQGNGDLRKPAYLITPDSWASGVKACKGSGTLLQLETSFRPHESTKAICKSGAVFIL